MEIKILWDRVEKSLDGIRPYLQKDGGDVEIVEITDDLVLKLKLVGACETCPQNIMTMKAGIEESVKRDVPEIKDIQANNPVES